MTLRGDFEVAACRVYSRLVDDVHWHDVPQPGIDRLPEGRQPLELHDSGDGVGHPGAVGHARQSILPQSLQNFRPNFLLSVDEKVYFCSLGLRETGP